MPRLTYTNSKGESIEFSNRPPFILSKFEGLGDVDADVQTQKSPYQDGETHVDTVLEPRYIKMEISVVGKEIDEYRRQLSKVMNPKFNGVLRYEDESVVREIECVNEHVPRFPEKTQSSHKAIVGLKAPNPYWQSTTITEEPMAAFVELFEFPSDYWEVGDDGNLYFEMGTEGHTRTFYNNGDSEVPIKITIKGPTLNPILTNVTTGELIKINRELSSEDVLEISTEDGNKHVLLNGENVFNWIDLSSTFWKLAVGENEIEYTADAGQESATLDITWQEQFVGV